MPRTTLFAPLDLTDVPVYARPIVRAFGAIIVGKATREVRKKHDASLVALEGLLKTLSENRKKMESVQMVKGVLIFNAAQFACLAQYDVSALAHDALLAKNEWRRKLYCRLLALTLIESVEDLSEMLGWKFRQNVSAVYNDPLIDNRAKAITRDMANFIKRHNKALREIRLMVSAHREHDATQQIRVIQNLDCAAILEIAAEFVKLNKAVLALLYELMMNASSIFVRLKMMDQ